MIARVKSPRPLVLPRVPIRVQIKQNLGHFWEFCTARILPIDTAENLWDHYILQRAR